MVETEELTQLTVSLPKRASAEEALRRFALALFVAKQGSLGWCATVAGMKIADFMSYVSGKGVPVIDYEEGELARELEMLRRRERPASTS